MKTTLLLFALLFVTFSFAQNRKSLLKEITDYKYHLYENETLPTTKNELKVLIQQFFDEKGYRFALEKDSVLTFVKRVPVVYKDQTFERETHGYKAGRYEERETQYYVEVHLQNENNQPKQPLVKTSQEKLRNGTATAQTIGQHNFNKLAFYSYLHLKVYGRNLSLSAELLLKIKNYNNQQAKEKNKLIAGRNY